ncbi:MAG TPA: class I SAM-dependent methyltransferase [Cyclobacteriaceae bacterium]|nr:methyltransferase domain-containing protein [Cytophagales bacterium]HMR58360.1 class I SAM-dependent methyltransferase [Cyclobacteriaceae bacterium]HRE65555.1 class I SAM-dependent methyltransferase [Cyclobacteriaceae bacterium]HRF32527.1 class I SAM-dependent methyltransferase [Cyclobacteriaceae bacterium]
MQKILLLLFITTASTAQDAWKDVYKESAWADRDRWQKADELIRQLNLKPESHVADVGCHQGYMTVKLAAKAAKVYAVDVDQPKLDKLNVILKQRSIKNVKTIKGDYDDPKLEPNSVDGVIILDTYHEMDDHDEILKHIKSALKPGGRLVLCEAIAESRRKESRQVQEGKHELGMNFALDDLRKAGFVIVKQQDPFVDRTAEKGDKMWLIVAEKPAN